MKRQIEPIAHKTCDFREAEAWDIEQHLRIAAGERQGAASQLRARVYGEEMLRSISRFHRELLPGLCLCAREALRDFLKASLSKDALLWLRVLAA